MIMYEFQKIDGYLLVKIENDLVLGEHDDLEDFLKESFTPDLKGIVLDLTKTEYIDSSGISIILRLRKRYLSISKDIILVVNNPRIRKVFKVSRIDNLLNIIESVESFKEKKPELNKYSPKKSKDFELKEFKLVIPSEYNYIKIVQDFVLNIMNNIYYYSNTDEYDIKMSLEETLSNAIEHGYKDFDLEGLIQILVLCKHDEIIIFIDDYGKGYDKNKILDEADKSINDPYEVRGRGFLILKGITDDLHYDSVKNKVSSVIIVKKLRVKE